MDKTSNSWLDSILNAGTTAYGAWTAQKQPKTTAAPSVAPAKSALPAWAIPAAVGAFVLLIIAWVATRK